MKRKPNLEELNKFIKENYKSKAAFGRALNISKSYLYGILTGCIDMGDTVFARLNDECIKMKVNTEDLMRPKPILIGGKKVEEIFITSNGELMASITSRDIIEKNGCKVIFMFYPERREKR